MCIQILRGVRSEHKLVKYCHFKIEDIFLIILRYFIVLCETAFTLIN